MAEAPSMVVKGWHVKVGPYGKQSVFDEQSTQQMSAPDVLAAHAIAGDKGHWGLLVHVCEHHPWPAPPLTHMPEVHSGFVVQGAPDGKLVQNEMSAHTSCPCCVVVQQSLTQPGFDVQVSAQSPPDPKLTQYPMPCWKSQQF
jgi:hypothetical protein